MEILSFLGFDTIREHFNKYVSIYIPMNSISDDDDDVFSGTLYKYLQSELYLDALSFKMVDAFPNDSNIIEYCFAWFFMHDSMFA